VKHRDGARRGSSRVAHPTPGEPSGGGVDIDTYSHVLPAMQAEAAFDELSSLEAQSKEEKLEAIGN